MTGDPLSTILIGAGRIGTGYADDVVMARHYPYAAHAQVLRDHDAFAWEAVIDADPAAARACAERWNLREHGQRLRDLTVRGWDVAVIATPPEGRLELLDQLPDVKAVLVEKPLGNTIQAASHFVAACRDRGIVGQANLWRRFEPTVQETAARLRRERVHAVFGIYGNGIRNNGTHMVDLCRVLFGEVEAVHVPRDSPAADQPDLNVPFDLLMRRGPVVHFAPVPFEEYRENGLDIWTDQGRVSFVQEGLLMQQRPVAANRAMTGEREVASDQPVTMTTEAGNALHHVYTNVAATLMDTAMPLAPLADVMQTTIVVEAIIESSKQPGRWIDVEEWDVES